MSKGNVDFLFSCFDKNHDGFVSANELITVLNDFKTKADRRYEIGPGNGLGLS